MREKRSFRPAWEGLETRVVASAGLTLHAARVVARADTGELVPLRELGPGQTYDGMSGGLYGQGSNRIPTALLSAALRESARVTPLDRFGRPSAGGGIGVVAIGPSVTNLWFPAFQSVVSANRSMVRPGVFLVNGGQDSMVAQNWAGSVGPWATLAARVGARRREVQVAFLDAPMSYGQALGGAAAQATAYAAMLTAIVATAKRTYPNLRLVYVFPFHWSGNAGAGKSVTEPSAYALQFGERQLILNQSLKAPVAVWGPPVWDASHDPSLYFDGVHYKPQGAAWMAGFTWQFLGSERTARWFWR